MESSQAVKIPQDILEKLPEDLDIRLKEYHCGNCGRFLCLQALIEGTVVIKCRRCKEWNILDARAVEEP